MGRGNFFSPYTIYYIPYTVFKAPWRKCPSANVFKFLYYKISVAALGKKKNLSVYKIETKFQFYLYSLYHTLKICQIQGGKIEKEQRGRFTILIN